MTSERWRQIEAVYQVALGLPSTERRAYLARACADDADLRNHVEALLAGETMESTEPSFAQVIGPGARLGPYQLEALLGEGGMGQVYRARDTRLGRLVAIKVIRAERVQQGDFRIRFQREARATAALNHPHICTLYDVGEQHGASYLVMEYVEGPTLASRLREGPLPFELLLRSAAEIAQALAAAHERGIIHRDLKPANLVLTSAGIKVLDFGLAKFAGSEEAADPGATAAHTILGTPSYMSPEQARGEELDPRSDVFSLGSVLYEFATGVRPFRGGSLHDVLREVASAHPAPASSLRPELPMGWDGILHQALAKDRERRFQSAADLFQAIEALRSGTEVIRPRIEEREPDPIFGRDRELAKLSEFLQSAVGGTGRVAIVTGEPGIGKTALTRAFVYRARKQNADLLLARGACVEQYGAGEAYLVFLDALGSLLQGPERERATAILRRYAPTWCLQFPAVFSSDAVEQLKREATGATKDRMLRELGDAISALTQDTPVLLLLEDVHWIDPASVDMMRHLAERAREQRLMVLATARPEDIERGNPTLKKCYTEMHARGVCEEIALAGLEARDIGAYLDANYSPNEFPPELAAVIHSKSEGHALFATGAIQLLAERGDITRDNGAWKLKLPLTQIELDAPVSVRSMIEKKVGLLSEEQRQTLTYASIEGEEFTSTTLAALLEADELELEERLDTLGKVHRLIRVEREEDLPDGSVATVYRFTHALYQYFLYDQLLSKRRILLHKRAAEILERAYAGQHARIAASLATHFERGRDFSRSVNYLIQAGDNAVSRFANAEATSYYTRGLDLVDKVAEEERAAVRIMLLRKRAVARLAIAQLKDSFADFAAMREACVALGNQDEECRALIGLTTTAFNLRDLTAVEQYGPESIALAERIGNQPLVAEAYTNWGSYRVVTGELADAQHNLDHSVRLARSIGHRPALPAGLLYRGVVHFWKSEYETAEQTHLEASQIAAEVRDGFYWPLSLFYLGLAKANGGKLSEALTSLQAAHDLAKRNSNGVALSRAPNGLGWVWREIGDLGKAIEFNEGCVETSRRLRAAEAEANGLINLVHDYLHVGESAKAAEALEAVLPLYERERWNRWRFYGIRHRAAEAEYWLTLGKPDRAEEPARTLLQNAQKNGIPKYIGAAHRLLGEIAAARGDHNSAEELMTESLKPFAANPTPLMEWRNYVALGRLLAARNRPAAAREAFGRAETLIRKLADGITDQALRDQFLKMNAVREVIAGAAGQ